MARKSKARRPIGLARCYKIAVFFRGSLPTIRGWCSCHALTALRQKDNVHRQDEKILLLSLSACAEFRGLICQAVSLHPERNAAPCPDLRRTQACWLLLLIQAIFSSPVLSRKNPGGGKN